MAPARRPPRPPRRPRPGYRIHLQGRRQRVRPRPRAHQRRPGRQRARVQGQCQLQPAAGPALAAPPQARQHDDPGARAAAGVCAEAAWARGCVPGAPAVRRGLLWWLPLGASDAAACLQCVAYGSQHAPASQSHLTPLARHALTHTSLTLQTSTAHGSMLVEDDFDAWMPTGTGCDAIKQVLSAAEDIILDITLVFFKYAAGEDCQTAMVRPAAALLRWARCAPAVTGAHAPTHPPPCRTPRRPAARRQPPSRPTGRRSLTTPTSRSRATYPG